MGRSAMNLIASVSELPLSMPTSSHPLHAYMLLVSAIQSLSEIGPLLNWQGDEVGGALKIYWLPQPTPWYCFPLWYTPWVGKVSPDINVPWTWLCLFLVAANYGVACVFIKWALEWISVSDALILTNCQSLLLLVNKWYMGMVPIELWDGNACVVMAFMVPLCVPPHQNHWQLLWQLYHPCCPPPLCFHLHNDDPL